MARPLTKRKNEGARYARPAAVEAQIDEAIQLDLTSLRARLLVKGRESPGYLLSECLVHLIREGRRRNDQALMSAVMPILLRRCEANLRVKIPEDRFPHAASLWEEVLSEFSELFAVDGSGQRPDQLDFFECRFNRAFRVLRIDLLRLETARRKHLVQAPEEFEKGKPAADEEASGLSSLKWQALGKELVHAIDALPADEREAVVLVHILGYKQESEDPEEVTAATRCHCTGKTIRNRLTRAAAKLARFKEEL
jgi:hypothetical protein